MDLWTTHTHGRELQVITVPSLISTIRKSKQHTAKIFPACCIFTSRSLATAYNRLGSSASRASRRELYLTIDLSPKFSSRKLFGTDHAENTALLLSYRCVYCAVTQNCRGAGLIENTVLLLLVRVCCEPYLATVAVYRVTS
jgi:hypothetical protein